MFWDKKTLSLLKKSNDPVYTCVCWLCVIVCSPVDQELGFQDKYLFYRFLDDEEEDTPLPSEEEKRESEEELPETILFLAQIGPDALLRMILRKSSVPISNIAWCIYITLSYFIFQLCWWVGIQNQKQYQSKIFNVQYYHMK